MMQVAKQRDDETMSTGSKTVRHIQQRELVLSSDECILLVNQHEPLLHHSLLLLLVVAWRMHTEKNKQLHK